MVSNIGPDFIVNSTTPNTQAQSNVAGLSNGNFVEVWISEQDGPVTASVIRARLFTADGDPVGLDFLVDSTPAWQSLEPAITVLDDGRFVVLWASAAIGATHWEVRGRLFNADGSAVGSDFVVNTSDTAQAEAIPSVAATPDGGFVAIWNSADGTDLGGRSIRSRIFDSDGNAVGPDFKVNSTSGNWQYNPDIAVLPDGHFVATWQLSNDGSIRARLFEADGTPVGSDFTVNSSSGNFQAAPAITALLDGHFVVTWLTSVQGEIMVRARLFDADGTPSGVEFAVDDSPTAPTNEPSIATLSDGRFVVTWSVQDTTFDYIRGRIFEADGNPSGPAFGVPTTVEIDDNQGKVGALSDGGFVVTWTGHGDGDGSETLIRARAFPGDIDTAVGPLFQGGTTSETINGTGADETFIGREGADTLNGLGGNDVFIWSAFASDALSVNAGDGSDVVDGGAGNDTFQAHLGPHKSFHLGMAVSQSYSVSVNPDNQHAYFTQLNGVSGNPPTATAQVDLQSIETLHIIGTPDDPPPSTPDVYSYSTADTIVIANLNATTLQGTITFDAGSGNDILDASAVSNVVTANGDSGADILTGGSANDMLSGGAGSDQLNGGAGDDTASFTGARSEYDIRTFASGGVLITAVVHQGGSQADGADVLTGIERLNFSDHAFILAHAQLNDTSSVDGDRFDDVLFQNATNGQIYFAQMINGAFVGWGVDAGALGAGLKAVGSGDVNPGPAHTGGAETFVQQQSTGAIYYASLDTGSTTWGVVDAASAPDWKLRAVADMNGDAAADAVVQSASTGAIRYAAMFNGTFQGYETVNQSLTADWLLVGAGDVNRDGLADAVIQQQSTGTTYYAVMANGMFQSWGVVSQNLTPDWHVKAVADVTGDSFADVIVQQASTGTTYFADMTGGVLDHWGVVTANVTADWVVQGTADVDNDGFNDVLFQNSVGSGVNPGTTYYANMGPGGFEGWGNVASNISSDWHVV